MDGRAWVMPLSIRIALILLTPINRSYGTPFLLSLGLSEQLTSLVWLAGPLGGLIAQPIIGGSKPLWILHRNLTKSPSGAISDSSHSKYRRRYWVVLSTAVLCISTLVLAYCQGIAAFFVDLFGGGAGDWDPKRIEQVSIVSKFLTLLIAVQVSGSAIGLAVVSFYLLDFAINALQASLRNLLLDVTPPEQLNAANAWHGRMTHAGNIIGFGFGKKFDIVNGILNLTCTLPGFLPLANLPVLRLLGGGQFQKFCVVAMAILAITVWITCFCHEEKATQTMQKREKRCVVDGASSCLSSHSFR